MKEEQTQHGWRVERLSFEENRDFGQILNVGIKTNYRKSAQTVSFDLRKVNPVHDPDAESEAYIFSPVIRVSAWLPQDAIDDRGYKPGLSFLCTRPIGCPTPLSFSKNWYNNHKVFIMCIKEEFSEVTQKDAGIIEDWKIFTETVLPPSQFMIDYVTKMGSNFFPPLCQYLYGLRPRGFSQLRSSVTAGVIENASRFLSTSFAGVNMTRATLVDKALENIVCQNRESVEWRGNTTSLKAWQFDVPEMLAKVIVEVKQRVDLSREDKSYKMENIEHEGTIVAFCKSDINEGDVFQVIMLLSI